MKKKFSMVPLTKKMVPVLLSAVFLLPLTAHSAVTAGSLELSPFVGYNFFEKGQNLKDTPVFGARIGYNLTNQFAIEATGQFMRSSVDDKSELFTEEGEFTSPINHVRITMYHLDLVYHFLPESQLTPFIVAGYGGAHYDPKINNRDMATFDLGVGAKYWMAKNLALRLDLRDNMVYDERIHNLEATLGVVFAIGGKKSLVAARSDNTAPTVIFTSPANGSTAVEVTQQAKVAFSETMDPATITAKTFTLKQGANPVSGRVTASAATAAFIPAYNLEKNKAYTATITTGAKDPDGNALATNYEWGFSTGLAADTTPPTVIFTSPVNGATAAPVNQKVHAAFSEPIDPATINATTFTVKQGTIVIPGKVSSSAAVATFTPSSEFEKGKVYTGTITTGSKDLAGNSMANNYVWNFTAHTAVDIAPCVLATLEDSHFLYNSAEINENGKTILNLNSQILKDNPKMKIRIAGYASASGTEEYNQKLSEKRAAAVKNYLINQGVSSDRLATIGYGETSPAEYEPIPSDINSAAAKANMRVLFEVIGK